MLPQLNTPIKGVSTAPPTPVNTSEVRASAPPAPGDSHHTRTMYISALLHAGHRSQLVALPVAARLLGVRCGDLFDPQLHVARVRSGRAWLVSLAELDRLRDAIPAARSQRRTLAGGLC